jgi:uncharacterized membrane protein YiaA
MIAYYIIEAKKRSDYMSAQSVVGLIFIIIGIVISLIGIFLTTPTKDFLTSVLITTVGFIFIIAGGAILKARFGKWVNK